MTVLNGSNCRFEAAIHGGSRAEMCSQERENLHLVQSFIVRLQIDVFGSSDRSLQEVAEIRIGRQRFAILPVLE